MKSRYLRLIGILGMIATLTYGGSELYAARSTGGAKGKRPKANPICTSGMSGLCDPCYHRHLKRVRLYKRVILHCKPWRRGKVGRPPLSSYH